MAVGDWQCTPTAHGCVEVVATELMGGTQFAVANVWIYHAQDHSYGTVKQFTYNPHLEEFWAMSVYIPMSSAESQLTIPPPLVSADTQFSPTMLDSDQALSTLRCASMPLFTYKDCHGRTLLDIARAHHAVTIIAAIENRLQVSYFHLMQFCHAFPLSIL